jgi:hypothetical protein
VDSESALAASGRMSGSPKACNRRVPDGTHKQGQRGNHVVLKREDVNGVRGPRTLPDMSVGQQQPEVNPPGSPRECCVCGRSY